MLDETLSASFGADAKDELHTGAGAAATWRAVLSVHNIVRVDPGIRLGTAMQQTTKDEVEATPTPT